MSWLICRAFRRMARIVGVDSLALAKRLRLRDAWPAIPLRLPDPDLKAAGWLCYQAAARPDGYPVLMWAATGLWRTASKMEDAGLRLVRDAKGNCYKWRLR